MLFKLYYFVFLFENTVGKIHEFIQNPVLIKVLCCPPAGVYNVHPDLTVFVFNPHSTFEYSKAFTISKAVTYEQCDVLSRDKVVIFWKQYEF